MSKLFHPLSASIGLRYIRAKRNSNFISFISIASVAGVALGVMVLITVLSVINGFEEGARTRILGVLSHVTVSEMDGKLKNWEQRREQLLKTDRVTAAAPFVEKQIMLNESGEVQGAMLEGIIPQYEKQIGNLNESILDGVTFDVLQPGKNSIILGVILAEKLNVKTGDTLTLLSPDFSGDVQQGLPLLKEFTVAGIFKVDMQQYDSATAYVHMQDAVDMFDMADDVTGLRLSVDDIFKSRQVAQNIVNQSENDFWVSDWTLQHQNFFKALQLQKSMLFLVLGLIVAVAAFNLVSTLIMVVTDKSGDIAILKTLGMTPSQVMKIFIIQGSVLGLIGVVIGLTLGLLLASNITYIVPFIESILDRELLSAEVYGTSKIDSKIEMFDVLFVSITAFILAIVATIYPARKAAKMAPAEALRYE